MFVNVTEMCIYVLEFVSVSLICLTHWTAC